MLNLNLTFFFQLVMFLTFLWVLSKFLFKPIIQTFDERIEKTEGSVKKAKELEEQLKIGVDEYEERLNKARVEASAIKEGLKKEGIDEEKNILQQISQKTKEEIEERKVGINKEIQQVKTDIDSQADEISRKIVEKVLGRRIK